MKKVLIIEDNIAIRENTAELLELNNFRVLTAETGREGYESAKKYLPDVIIYNMTMPEMDGENFHNLLRNEPVIKNIPFVYLADGFLSPEFRRHDGNGAYLQKPFTEEKLVLIITKALQGVKT
jgi:CheY-like chemotaxis protein